MMRSDSGCCKCILWHLDETIQTFYLKRAEMSQALWACAITFIFKRFVK